jgi:protein-arginine kinase activator protein McsA
MEKRPYKPWCDECKKMWANKDFPLKRLGCDECTKIASKELNKMITKSDYDKYGIPLLPKGDA